MSEGPDPCTSFKQSLRQEQNIEGLGTFAGWIAHDLNNHLTVILNNLDVTLAALGAEHSAYNNLVDVHRAGERCLGITDGLLSLSRRTKPKLKKIELEPLLEETETMLLRLTPASISVHFEIQHPLPLVMADVKQIKQVILHLALNACEAMPAGGYLAVKAEKCSGYVAVSVSDTGSGMSREEQEHIFEPFFTRKAEDGAGLGMATVLAVIRAHGGWISLNSHPQQGTSFRICFPTGVAGSEMNGQRPTSSESICVLLVEDEALVRRSAWSILNARGHRVIEARDAEEAVQVFSEQADQIDLVFLDMTLPHISGLEALEQIQRVRPFAKVLLTSGYEMGVDVPFIQKPYSATKLLAKIQDLMQG